MKVFNRGIQIGNFKTNLNFNYVKRENTKTLKILQMSFHANNYINKQLNGIIRNNKAFYLFGKKNMFEKLKEQFNKTDQNKLKEIFKREEYYVPQENIVFVNKKYQIMEAGKNFTDSIKFLQNFLLYPIIALCSFFFLRALIRLKIITSFFSGFLSVSLFRINFGVNQNKKHIITKIFLLENGQECEIHTLEKTFTIDIKNIRRLQVEEGLYLARNIQRMTKNYIPLAIDAKLYLIPLVSVIQNQELLSAISNGKYIRTDGQIEIGDTIDIDNDEKHKY